MSGICGIFRLDGAEPQGIEAMTALLERRGPDGTHHFRDGPCALGHTLLATTPEALHEVLPLTHAETGCTITADVRLDNREVLIPALGLSGETRVIGDGELILLAYLKWGQGCLDHFLGDFAFAIWDPRVRQVFAARDQMGMKQLIHCHVDGKVWAFASEPRAVLAAPDVPKIINEGRIADFLEGYLEGIDFTSTFFEGVSRLPPAHYVIVDAAGLRIRRYWTLTPGPMLKLESEEAYAAAFLEVFTDAVRCRLRAPEGAIGSMLSGGMDSGSVVAVAARLLAAEGRRPLQTFSGVGPDADTCIETRSILASATMSGLRPQLLDWSKIAGVHKELDELVRNSQDAFDSKAVLTRWLYLAANREGVRVMLDGVAGDIALHDQNRIAWLLREGNLFKAVREAQYESAFHGNGWTTWLALRAGLVTALGFSWVRTLRQSWRTFRGTSQQSHYMNDAFVRRVDLDSRIRKAELIRPSRSSTFKQERVLGFTGPSIVVARESHDRIAAERAIEPRDPFLDLRVVEFCVRLPPRLLGAAGWPKRMLRIGMAGLLPDEVRWRRGKEHLGWNFRNEFVRLRSPNDDPKKIAKLRGMLTEEFMVSTGHNRDLSGKCLRSFRLFALSDWFDRFGAEKKIE